MNIVAKTVCLATLAAFCAIGVMASGDHSVIAEVTAEQTERQVLAQCVVPDDANAAASVLADPAYNPTSTAR